VFSAYGDITLRQTASLLALTFALALVFRTEKYEC
jgi:hypothetical protein